MEAAGMTQVAEKNSQIAFFSVVEEFLMMKDMKQSFVEVK